MTIKISRRDDKVVVIDNQGYKFSLFIPSRKRENRVINHPLFEYANIIVHEDEYDAYASTFRELGTAPGHLMTHNVVGLAAIHNQMLLNYHPDEESWQMHTDDDYAGFMYLQTFRAAKGKISDPQKIIDIMTHVGIAATDAGTGLFCWAQSSIPQERHSYDPFNLRGWGMSACMGFIDPDLRFDDNLPVSVDIDMCLQAIAKHRFIWQDRRWWDWCDEKGSRTGADPGGLAGIRVPSTIAFAHKYLTQKWGSDVVRSKEGKQRGVGLTLKVKIPK